MSALGQQRTFGRVAKENFLYSSAFGGLEIDDKFELGWLLAAQLRCAALGRHPGARLLRAGLFAAFFEKFGSLLCTQLVERLEHQTDLFSVFGFRVHLLKPIHQRGIFGT